LYIFYASKFLENFINIFSKQNIRNDEKHRIKINLFELPQRFMQHLNNGYTIWT